MRKEDAIYTFKKFLKNEYNYNYNNDVIIIMIL